LGQLSIAMNADGEVEGAAHHHAGSVSAESRDGHSPTAMTATSDPVRPCTVIQARSRQVDADRSTRMAGARPLPREGSYGSGISRPSTRPARRRSALASARRGCTRSGSQGSATNRTENTATTGSAIRPASAGSAVRSPRNRATVAAQPRLRVVLITIGS
jgi:hypothetical protein